MSSKRVERRQEGKSMRNWKRNFAGMLALRGSDSDAMMVRLRRLASVDAGAAVVEMGIASALLFSMFFGVFEISLASYTSHFVADAAREGARYAIVRGSLSCTNTPSLSNCGASPDTIANYVKHLNYPGIDPAKLTVNVSYLTGTGDQTSGSLLTTWACTGTCTNLPGNMVNVQVSYAFGISIPFVPHKNITVSSTSQMVVQQ
jgi:Flp pilus assembly protein TadG